MVRTYNCGMIAPPRGLLSASFFSGLPLPGDSDYVALQQGLERFRKDHSGEAVRSVFLRKLFAG
jgi:hypothetical protein